MVQQWWLVVAAAAMAGLIGAMVVVGGMSSVGVGAMGEGSGCGVVV